MYSLLELELTSLVCDSTTLYVFLVSIHRQKFILNPVIHCIVRTTNSCVHLFFESSSIVIFLSFFFVLNQTCQRILFKSIGTIVKVSQTRAQVPDKETKLKEKKKKENTCGNFASLPKQ